jgi:hypothetical protein
MISSLQLSLRAMPILAQAAGGLAEGASKAWHDAHRFHLRHHLRRGAICVRRGDTDAGKLSIIGGLIIAGAPVIVKGAVHRLRPRWLDRGRGAFE